MGTERDILILLSTYNGERFLPAQLESVRTQTIADRIHIVIRDDGSTDSTVSLIESMDMAPLSIEVVRGENLGALDSFSTLICGADPSYPTIMLCDQDDVWMPDKAEIAAQALAGASLPTLYCGRSITTDDDLNPTGVTSGAPQGPYFRNSLFQNIAPGHTMAFNQALADLYRRTINPYILMHDWWLYCLAAGVGTVIFDPVPHTYYRLHSSNEIGYATSWVSTFVRDVKRLVTEDRSALTWRAEALWELVGPELSDENRAMLKAFVDQKTFASRWAYIRRYPMVTQNPRPPWTSTLLFLLGWYRKRRPSEPQTQVVSPKAKEADL